MRQQYDEELYLCEKSKGQRDDGFFTKWTRGQLYDNLQYAA